MNDDRCPGCNSRAVTSGGMEERVGYFFPDGIRWWRRLCGSEEPQSISLRTRGRFHACSVCGLVWSRLCPQQLRVILEHQSYLHEGNEGTLKPDPTPEKPLLP